MSESSGGSQPASAAKPSTRWWASKWFIGIAAFVVGVVMAGATAGGSSQPSASGSVSTPAPTVTVTATAAPEGPAPTVTATVTAESTVTVTAEPKASDVIEEGLYVVGEDVSAGQYKTAGPSGINPVGCYYAFKTGTGSDADIIDNNILKGQGRVTLKKGQVFETTGCEDWQKLG